MHSYVRSYGFTLHVRFSVSVCIIYRYLHICIHLSLCLPSLSTYIPSLSLYLPHCLIICTDYIVVDIPNQREDPKQAKPLNLNQQSPKQAKPLNQPARRPQTSP
jgi:hypothetical protein